MTCRELTGFLMAYLDGDLGVAEQAIFDEHLAACPNCVTYLEQYRLTVAVGRQAYASPGSSSVPDLPDALVRAILAARRH